MPVAVVANPKGGVGKSTLATNLAGYFAARDHAVMLGDTDRQQSLHEWLALHPETARPIRIWEVNADHITKPPKGTTHVVLDTPAGLHGWRLGDLVKMSGYVIMPLQPSMSDILATQTFLRKPANEKPVRHGEVKLGVVGMRADMRTYAAEQLQRFVQGLEVPILDYLRDTQNYVQLAAHDLTPWDVAPSRVAKDVEQWSGIFNWFGESPPQAGVADMSVAA